MSRWGFLAMLAFIICSFTSDTEKNYPIDYFRSPVGHDMRLSGTFGELRPNHFHMGIDIKPKYGIGEKLYSVADGRVSRINVSHRGYGNAIYIDHPNGYTSVYAHLHKFPTEIAEYVKAEQYARESFTLELYPDSTTFQVEKGEVIGYMGISGRSFGTHLHFEIRDTKSEVPINPLLFGLKVKDNVPPVMNQLKVYYLDHQLQSMKETVYTARKGSKNYYISKDTLEVGTAYLGLALKTYDRMDGVSNLNGIYRLRVLQDDQLIYEFESDAISFDETRYLNAHSDYAHWKKDKSRFNRCFILPGNQLSIYENVENDGLISLDRNQASKIDLIAEDLHGNASRMTIYAKHSDSVLDGESFVFNYVLPHDEPSIIQTSELELKVPEYALYEDLYLLYQASDEISDGYYSSIHHIGDPLIPIHKYIDITIKSKPIPERLKGKALIAKCDGSTVLESFGGKWHGDQLKAKIRGLGDYCIVLDTIPPTIRPIKVSSTMATGYRMSFKIEDNLAGISSYEGKVDGQWILMEYDQKYDLLKHRFDGRIPKGKHEFQLRVTDTRGNVQTYSKNFVN
ncbi:MAG: M23 family metallopeptidase [Bacteroidota bacterium]